MAKDIFSFIQEQEVLYSREYEVLPNWFWNMKEHVRASVLMKHGKFKDASNDITTKNPFKNIVYPLLNLRYRAEDIDLRDVMLYVDGDEDQHLSFLVKKYHDDVYVRENNLDTLFDELKEEKIDFGGSLARKGSDGPMCEPLDSIAFCDQTDMLSGPIGFRMFLSPDELYDMKKYGWGEPSNGATTSLDELVTLAETSKQQDPFSQQKTETPGKYIEVYRVHGMFPSEWIGEGVTGVTRQLHIIGFYKDEKGNKNGVILYHAREYENPFKVHLSGKKIRNRALALGGVEEIFDAQIWTNYSEIRKKEMLDAAAKVIFQTNDENYADRNRIKDMENLEITVIKDNGAITQVPNGSPNIQLFNEWIREWDVLSQTVSGATEMLMGKTPPSGTPFSSVVTVAQQGMGLHDYRRGKFATFLEELYNDWIIPDITKKIMNGVSFLSTLSLDEMEFVADKLADNLAEKYKREKIFALEVVTREEVEALKDQIRTNFKRGGTKRFIEILKDEFKGKGVRVKVNIAGKQRDMVALVNKMVNVFSQVISNPQVLQDPNAVKVFNKLIEYSGLDPIDFGYVKSLRVNQLPEKNLSSGFRELSTAQPESEAVPV